MPFFNIRDLIIKKRDGRSLSRDEIQYFVDCVSKNSIEDCQLGAILMAVYLQGMTQEETSHLTRCMMRSGETLEWPEQWKGIVVDKHSTGGVGDKITLSLVPALAACGLKVPTISGRGLELTGGTLDKLESIPGYNVNQSTESMKRILHKVGCCIVGQTETLVPADKKMYCTRDVTGTVDNLPLIIGSIMSKKCVENLDALVLDVKTGCGAVIPDKDIARDLAKRMRNVGQSLGIKTTAFLTDMNQPTGYMIGNALEIVETLECLRYEGPASTQELIEVQGGYLLYNVNKVSTPEDGRTMIAKALKDGSALKKFYELLKAQGVSKEDAYKLCYSKDDVFMVLPKAKLQTHISALSTGYVTSINAFKCGKVNCWLGAGRVKTGQPVDHAVGLELHVQIGDHINKGEPWLTVHHSQELLVEQIKMLQEALTVSAESQNNAKKSLILEII